MFMRRSTGGSESTSRVDVHTADVVLERFSNVKKQFERWNFGLGLLACRAGDDDPSHAIFGFQGTLCRED